MMTLIDEVLSNHGLEDKAAILDIARRYKLDDEDPAFVLLLATGALERLLEQYPERLQAIMTEMLNGDIAVRSQLNQELVQIVNSQQNVKQAIEESIEKTTQSVLGLADRAVRSQVAKQAMSVSKGIETGVKANLALHIKKLIPVIAITAVLIFFFGLMSGILVCRAFSPV